MLKTLRSSLHWDAGPVHRNGHALRFRLIIVEAEMPGSCVAQAAHNVVAFPYMARLVSSFCFLLLLFVGQGSLLAQSFPSG